ncbi:ubiquinone-binding protein [Paucibacter aquatile]|uniref:Ubiquinone-binding protein n=1 Tax=Kinneretia aquatilis TaxID=2070761 RepID=A0A2N8KV01_9BURK|nr:MULTISPECIES: type II toxin-antitoxin system RatA family toxin [Roseateles]PND37285.1 ubiquinone-binding protein [Paucibacter aquatile]WIV96256.1 type II toxin-antitoxin system RatA family toxin [Paucibacter aquatile]
MKHVRKSVLLWYSPREMYDLVVGVERYPEFLPWCERAEVLEQQGDAMTARLSLSYAGVRHAFTTRNTHETDRSVGMTLVDGPFSSLDGVWHFHPLQKPGSDSPEAVACKIEFELRYAFSSAALEAVVSPVFDRIANTFVDRFVQRAESVYGPR